MTAPTLATDPIGWHAHIRQHIATLSPQAARRFFDRLPAEEQAELRTVVGIAMDAVLTSLRDLRGTALKEVA